MLEEYVSRELEDDLAEFEAEQAALAEADEARQSSRSPNQKLEPTLSGILEGGNDTAVSVPILTDASAVEVRLETRDTRHCTCIQSAVDLAV